MQNYFSIYIDSCVALLTPLTAPAKSWLDENVDRDSGYQPYWPTVIVEHRYIAPIIEALKADGLSVSLPAG
mgnify:CR=1 FL=1